MLYQGRIKRGHLNWFSFYVALVLLLVVLMEIHKSNGNSLIEPFVQLISVFAFYGFIALCLRFDNNHQRKRKEDN